MPQPVLPPICALLFLLEADIERFWRGVRWIKECRRVGRSVQFCRQSWRASLPRDSHSYQHSGLYAHCKAVRVPGQTEEEVGRIEMVYKGESRLLARIWVEGSIQAEAETTYACGCGDAGGAVVGMFRGGPVRAVDATYAMNGRSG